MAGPRSWQCYTPIDDFRRTDFSVSGFLQEEGLTNLQPTNLSGPILDVFDRSRFAEEFDYDKMETVLRLASHLLITALPFLHAILSGRHWPADEVDKDGYDMWQFAEPLEELTDEQTQFTLQRLSEMGRHVKYSLAKDLEGFGGTCYSRCKEEVTLNHGLPGSRSDISFSESTYRAFLWSQADPTDLVRQQLGAFSFASLMCHELAHAAFNAAIPAEWQWYGMFVGENGQSTEHGYELQSYLFGGVLPEEFWLGQQLYWVEDLQEYSALDSLLCSSQWPCPATELYYEECGAAYSVRGEGSDVQLLWSSSFLHIHKMFQDQFWDEEVAAKGRSALFFERSRGYRFLPRGKDATRRVPVDTDPLDNIGVPEGYLVDELGLIYKKPGKLARMQLALKQDDELNLRNLGRKARELRGLLPILVEREEVEALVLFFVMLVVMCYFLALGGLFGH